MTYAVLASVLCQNKIPFHMELGFSSLNKRKKSVWFKKIYIIILFI